MNRIISRACIPMVLLFASTTPSSAATIHVAQDGSGDFASLRDAEAAAAVGDTLLVHPGWYSDTYVWTSFGGSERDVVLGIQTPDLVVRGTSRDDVIIGPLEPEPRSSLQIGIAVREDVPSATIENLTLQNNAVGTQVGGHDILIRDLVVRTTVSAAILSEADTLTVEDCSLHDVRSGISLATDPLLLRVARAQVENFGTGVELRPGNTGEFTSLRLENGVVGVQADNATVVIRDGEFHSMVNDAIVCLNALATATLERCRIFGGAVAVTARDRATVGVDSCRFIGATSATFDLVAESVVTVHSSEILPLPTARFVETGYYRLADPPLVLDFTNNYWGTSDAEEIAAGIVDFFDDPPLGDPRELVIIDFEPFEVQPVSTRSHSAGRLKAWFGRGQ